MFDRVIDLIMEFVILAMQFFAILLVFVFFLVSLLSVLLGQFLILL